MAKMLKSIRARNPLIQVATKKRDRNKLIKIRLENTLQPMQNSVISVPSVPQEDASGTLGTLGTLTSSETDEKKEEPRNEHDKCIHDIPWVECYVCNPDHPKRHKLGTWGEG